MLKAGSKWKIYTRNGGIMFSINKDIVLISPNKGGLSPPDSIMAKYPWFSEVQKEKLTEVWNPIERIHPSVRLIQIVQVEDYYCLISEGFYDSHDYRMFPVE